MQFFSSKALFFFLAATTAANAQFACTFSGAQDESGCVSTTDGGSHCVWCELSAFGFCISESQAEAMEQTIPGVQCDRYSGDDDKTPEDDDKTPATDDGVNPTDDSIPDDFWMCLQKKTAKDCTDDCTWCDTKAGFGVCMSGPAAESAAQSDWFDCKTEEEEEESIMLRAVAPAKNPYDASCITAFLSDQTEAGCTAATDESGSPCEWCTVAGMANVCLTAEQAAMGASIGIACDSQKDEDAIAIEDPFDTACAMAFLQDNTKEGCESAKDSDGVPCEFCSMQGAFDICLNEEQAEMAEQLGLQCGDDATVDTKDPYDTSCMLAYLQDQSKEGCVAAVDSDGNACEFCSLSGMFDICLTAEQAEYGEALGITCEKNQELIELASE